MQPDTLAGKTAWFLWNGSALGRDWPARLRGAVGISGVQSIALKTYDGPDAFSQPFSLHDMREALSEVGGLAIGAWGYHYGRDVDGELVKVARAFDVLGADYAILNVEDPAVPQNPRVVELWSRGLEKLTADYPDRGLYFCGHAQPRYHEQQPYYQATQAGLIHMPMIYHTAMERYPANAVDVAMEQFAEYGLIPSIGGGALGPWSSAGAAYSVPGWPITEDGIEAWAVRSVEWGATSLIWWALDSALDDADILRAVKRAGQILGKEKDRNCE